MVVFEERRIYLHKGQLGAYREWSQATLWPDLAAHGGGPICLLQGLIGNPVEELVQIVRFPDAVAWERAQQGAIAGRAAPVAREEARLLLALTSRPGAVVPPEDRRPVYGYRRFFIRLSDLDEIVRCSSEGVWPRFEAHGTRILGLWRTAATTDPLEIVLLTGYDSVAHWEATRLGVPRPAEIDPAVWEAGAQAGLRRQELTMTSWVCLMRALEVG